MTTEPVDAVDVAPVAVVVQMASLGRVEGFVRLDGLERGWFSGVRVIAAGPAGASGIETTTDERGRFSLELIAGEWTFDFVRAGYVSSGVDGVVVAAGETVALDRAVTLAALPARLRGRLRLSRFDTPARLADAHVRLARADGADAQSASVTDDGSFEFANMAPGAWRFAVELPGFESGARAVGLDAGEMRDLGVVWLRHDSETAMAAPLRGRVRIEAADEHAGTRIEIRDAECGSMLAVAQTDRDGRFAVPASADERYRATIVKPGFVPSAPTTVLTWSTFTGRGHDGGGFVDGSGGSFDVWLIEAPVEARLEVRVVLPPSADPAALTVRVRGAGVHAVRGGETRAIFAPLPAGVFAVRVDHPTAGRGQQTVRLTRSRPNVVLDDIALVAEPRPLGADFRGRTLDGDAPPADLAGADPLAGADLTDAVLVGTFDRVSLRDAQLVGATLRGVSLRGADLRGADLFGADLRGADLTGANLEGAAMWGADLTEARLGGIRAAGADFTAANISGASFSGWRGSAGEACAELGSADGAADLRGARLVDALVEGSDLRGADLRETRLDRARFVDSNLDGACLRRAVGDSVEWRQISGAGVDARNADLPKLRVRASMLGGARFIGARWTHGTLENVSFECEANRPACGSDFSGARLDGAVWRSVHANGARFDRARAVGWRVEGSRFGGAGFVDVDASGASWSETDASGADFERARLSDFDGRAVDLRGARFVDATLDGGRFDGARFDGSALDGASLVAASFAGVAAARGVFAGVDASGADFAGASLAGADFAGATLAAADFTGANLMDSTFVGMAASALDGACFAGADLLFATLRTEASFAALDLTDAVACPTWAAHAADGAAPAHVPPACAGWVRIEAGTFRMGSDGPLARRDESPHEVTLTRPFAVRATEITRAEWRALMDRRGEGADDAPMDEISWFEAVAWCNALSLADNLPVCYFDRDGASPNGSPYDMAAARLGREPVWSEGTGCRGYRLPTEAEWERAARAGTSTDLWSGDLDDGDCADPAAADAAWHCGNAGFGIHPVGRLAANPWGLYDVHGNATEWVWDAWAADYGGLEGVVDPTGPVDGLGRVRKGGVWHASPTLQRASWRRAVEPAQGSRDVGFRPVRTLD